MPFPDPARRGPAHAIEADGEVILVDCGASALHRFVEAGLDGKRLRRIALTHLHSDHITGLADLLWAGAIYRWWQRPPPVVGPPGTREFLTRLIDAFGYDLGVRAFDRDRVLPEIAEVEDGWAEDVDPFRLSAFRVDHGRVDQAFGFRLDLDRGSVVISGDTSRSESLVRSAAGASVLVHEVISGSGMEARIAQAADDRARDSLRSMLASHTPADQLGDIAHRAGAGHLVLSHINAAGRPAEELPETAQRGYDGRVTLGEDLMQVEV